MIPPKTVPSREIYTVSRSGTRITSRKEVSGGNILPKVSIK
jgi:hypothetical protein